MAFDSANTQPHPDPVEEARLAMHRRAAQPAYLVPPHLKGTLFSPRDCFEYSLEQSMKGLERKAVR